MDGDVNSWPDWTKHLSGVNHLLLAINSATNFIIYCSKDRKFRRALIKKTLPRCCYRMVPTSMLNSPVTNGGGGFGATTAAGAQQMTTYGEGPSVNGNTSQRSR